LMRPLFNKGLRPEAMSELMLELHSKKYFKDYIHREQVIKQSRGTIGFQPHANELFSTFGDKSKYAGCVPTGKYLSDVYKLFSASIREHLSKEVHFFFNSPQSHFIELPFTRQLFFK
jgi:hypothetical protein